MAKYIVHKAVLLDKVKVKRQKQLAVPGFLEENFYAQPKYDGCNMVCIVRYTDTGLTVDFKSRTGEVVKSCDHIAVALSNFPGLAEGVYLGEAWCPDATFAEISGWFRRQATDEDTCRLQFVLFDALTLEEWDRGESIVPYEGRALRLEPFGIIPQCHAPVWSAGGFGFVAKSFPGTTVQDVCGKLVEAGGYDGLILRDPAGLWVKGSNGTGGEIVKIKRVLSFDLRVTGVEEGLGKNAGRVGALVCSFNGKELRVGTGFSDVDRMMWWDAFTGRGDERHGIVGSIIEVEAMDYSEDGLLREPRMKGIRYDKTVPDA